VIILNYGVLSKLKKILYYISDHGRGHATRSIAIIRELQKKGMSITVRNSNCERFIKKALPNVNFISGLTDVGPVVKEDSLSIDVTKSKQEIGKWLKNLHKFADKEQRIISEIEPDLVISDISPMPFLATKNLEIKSVAISNFSWYDTIDFLPKDELTILKEAYDKASFAIQLPLGTEMSHFKKKKKVGIVARTSTRTRSEIREQIGIKNSDYLVLVALGGSKKEIVCKNTKDVKILSMDSMVKSSFPILNFSQWLEGQELVMASDLVIGKCGYGILSECLTNGIPFFYISDDSRVELRKISEELSTIRINGKTSYEELEKLLLDRTFIESLSRPEKCPIDTENVVNIILN